MKEVMFGPTGDFFVGSFNYPHLSWGPLVSVSETDFSPSSLYGASYKEIINARVSIARTKKFSDPKPPKKLVENFQEIAMSVKPIDAEVKFSRKPSARIDFSSVIQPMGPSAPLKKLMVAENPKIPKKVESIVNEDISATECLKELSGKFDVYYLSTLLSSGVLGKKKNKKLVPTRWSITAIDSQLANTHAAEVKEYREISEIIIFSNEYLHNHFEVLLMPGKWEFENFESWSSQSFWNNGEDRVITHEYEGFRGRSGYAEVQAGGYYATKFAVLEYLKRTKQQARVVVFREIGKEYVLPVGVWEVRENVRHAFLNEQTKCSSLDEALEILSRRLSTPLKEYLERSRILLQKRLFDRL